MSLSEYDARQLAKMKTQICSYQNGLIGVGELVADLAFLRDALEYCPVDWDLKFTEKLTDLESVNSYMIEKDATEPDKIAKPIVNQALDRINDLIEHLETSANTNRA